MTQYSKINIVYRMQKWMDSVPGQTFLNYAYSWGAAIVILGTLFKLTHLPGANIMLFIGMGTEVVVFFLSAFDRPFDKTADSIDIPTHVSNEYLNAQETDNNTQYVNNKQNHNFPQNASLQADNAELTQQQETLPQMADATTKYVEQLENLTQTLNKVCLQSEKLTTDSQEMENLNRTLTGICKIYEMQLKGASKQINTIDQINEQSNIMAKQIEQLNNIYARMIEAMTINMPKNTNNNITNS